MTRPGYESAEVLITVKTYPSPSKTYEETVCVAGVRLDGSEPSWIRLYPVRFRNVDEGAQFSKYERIEVDVIRHGSKDPRIESHRPDQDQLRVAGKVKAGGHWPERRELVGRLIGQTTTCELISANKAVKMSEPSESLGLIKPTIRKVEVGQGLPWTVDQLAKIDAASHDTLFGPGLKPLQPMPYFVRYEYKCESSDCKGHNQKVIDWELGQAGRSWRRQYGDAVALEKVREKWETVMCDPSVDLHFYIGNQHQRRHSFSVLGTWWPKMPPEPKVDPYLLF